MGYYFFSCHYFGLLESRWILRPRRSGFFHWYMSRKLRSLSFLKVNFFIVSNWESLPNHHQSCWFNLAMDFLCFIIILFRIFSRATSTSSVWRVVPSGMDRTGGIRKGVGIF